MCLSIESLYFELAPRLKLLLSANQNILTYMISRSKRIGNINGWINNSDSYDFVREAAKKVIILMAVSLLHYPPPLLSLLAVRFVIFLNHKIAGF